MFIYDCSGVDQFQVSKNVFLTNHAFKAINDSKNLPSGISYIVPSKFVIVNFMIFTLVVSIRQLTTGRIRRFTAASAAF